MSSQNIFALSVIPQADYVTPLTASSSPKNFRQIEKRDRQFAKFMSRASDNSGHSTGMPHPNRREGTEDDVEFTLTEDMSAQLLGDRALALFGDVDTTEVEEDEVYKHVFTIRNPQDDPQLPAYDYVEKDGESVSRPDAHNKRYPSAVCGQGTFRGQGTAKLEMSTTWTGSGKQIKPSAVNFYTSSHVKLLKDLAQNYFKNTQAELKLYPEKDLGGTAFEVACGFRDFEVSINHNLRKESGYQGCGKFQDQSNPDSNAIRGNCSIGDAQAIRFNFTMISNDDYDPQDKMMDFESISAALKYTGKTITGSHKYYALWKLLSANIAEANHTIVDGKNAWQIVTAPLSEGLVMPLELELVNNVKSYTVLADTW